MSTITPSKVSKVSYVSLPSSLPKSTPTILVAKVLPKPHTHEINVFKVDDNRIYHLSMVLQSSRCCSQYDVNHKVFPIGISKDSQDNPIYTPIHDELYGVLKVNESQFFVIQSEFNKGFNTLAIYRPNQYVSLWINPNTSVPSVTISLYSMTDGLTFTL